MTIKAEGPGTDPTVLRWGDGDDGVSGATWLAHPHERMERASHAVAVDGTVWVVEPVDAAGIDDLLAELGAVAGVVVLADYHRRDAAALARRHGVAVHLPESIAGLAGTVDAETTVVRGELADSGFRPVPLLGGFPWAEAALSHPRSGTLVATETLVTADALTGRDERLAVTPYVRLVPPTAPLLELTAARVLTGHGRPLLEDADAALGEALAGARRGALPVIARNLPYLLRAGAVALRD